MRIERSFIFFAILAIGISLASCEKDVDLNNVPVAEAGNAQSIQLPAASFTLSGSGTDSDGEVVAYLWSQVSGPVNTVIVNEGNANTSVTNFVAGSYIFQLMVTDEDGATGVDTVSVNVIAAPEVTADFFVIADNDAVLADLGGTDWTNIVCPDWHVNRWTNGGSPYVSRAIFKFDLSAIPAGATIVNAQLYLYSYPSPTLNGNFSDANLGNNNSMYLRRVINSWTDSGLSWIGQPSTTTEGQVSIPHTSQSQLDLVLDVKDLTQKMVQGENNGFMLRLQEESTAYQSRIFVSSTNTVHPTKRPKLVITYR